MGLKVIYRSLGIVCATVVALWAVPTDAATLLVDFNESSGREHTPSEAAAFSDAGVVEDLTGVTVKNNIQKIVWHGTYLQEWDPGPWMPASVLPSPPSKPLGTAGIEIFFSAPFRGVNHLWQSDYDTGNALLQDYVYLWDSAAGKDYMGGPVDVTIKGLSRYLKANTRYKFYLFGTAGLAEAQNSRFTFAGVTKTTATPVKGGANSVASVWFDYTTGSTVSDKLMFQWARLPNLSPNQKYRFAAWNGFALVELAEPEKETQ